MKQIRINKRSRLSRFTLLELIVAVAIFAVVISIASMGLVTVRKSWDKVYEHSARLKNLLKIDRVVDTSFRNIIPFSWKDEDTKKERGIFFGEEDMVTFAYMHRITNAEFSAIRFINLYVEDNKLIAEYSKSPILPWDDNQDEMGVKKEVLAENIERISFLYGDRDETGEISWNSSWVEEKPLNYVPLAIQITVEWQDGRCEQWLRRVAGAGKCESLGVRKKKVVEKDE